MSNTLPSGLCFEIDNIEISLLKVMSVTLHVFVILCADKVDPPRCSNLRMSSTVNSPETDEECVICERHNTAVNEFS